jgi:hypothetical protein
LPFYCNQQARFHDYLKISTPAKKKEKNVATNHRYKLSVLQCVTLRPPSTHLTHIPVQLPPAPPTIIARHFAHNQQRIYIFFTRPSLSRPTSIPHHPLPSPSADTRGGVYSMCQMLEVSPISALGTAFPPAMRPCCHVSRRSYSRWFSCLRFSSRRPAITVAQKHPFIVWD